MRKVNQCLNKQLISLCHKSMQIESLNEQIKCYLPSDVQNHCRVSSFEKGILTFVTDDAVWASQLRYALPEIRDRLRKEAGIYQLVSTKIIIDLKV